jgi:hypothetical protein
VFESGKRRQYSDSALVEIVVCERFIATLDVAIQERKGCPITVQPYALAKDRYESSIHGRWARPHRAI